MDEWDTLHTKCLALYERGKWAEGVQVSQRALELIRTFRGDTSVHLVKSLMVLARCYFKLRDYHLALPCFQEAVSLLSIRTDKVCASYCADMLRMVGSCYCSLGELVEAKAAAERALRLQKLHDLDEWESVLVMGDVAARDHDNAAALWWYSMAKQKALESKNDDQLMGVLCNMSVMYQDQKVNMLFLPTPKKKFFEHKNVQNKFT